MNFIYFFIYLGQSPQRLMASFMFTTMFLSMWNSNTATTAMMLPIVDAILVELYSKVRLWHSVNDLIPSSEEITRIKSSRN